MAAKKNQGLPKLKQQIKDNALLPLYLFYGTENYLKETYANAIRGAVPANGFEDFNHITLRGADIPLSEYDDAWESFPMMAERKFVYISGSGIFQKPTEEQKEFWKEKFARCADDMIVVFNEDSVDKRGVLYKSLVKNGMAIEFETPAINDMVTFITGRCLRAHRKIRRENARHIAELCGENLQSLVNELDKLFDYCGEEITKSDIDNVVSKSISIRIFDLTDAITAHNPKKAMEVLAELRSGGESVFGVMYLIHTNIKKILKAKFCGSSDPAYVSRLLGVQGYVAAKYISSARNFSEGALVRMLTRIPEIDNEIKLGKTDECTALEQYVAEALYYN